jgi:TP901 family phage tail tape measure protein
MSELETTGVKLIAKDAGEFLSDVKKAERGVKDFLDTADKGGPSLNVFGEIATGALRRIGEVAVDALGEAARATASFVADSVTAAGDYEAGLNRFGSVVGDALGEVGLSLDDVSAKALQMGADTQYSAAEALQAMTELAKGGVDVADIMGATTDATLTLAAAGEVELANAAEIVAKSLAVWSSTGVEAIDVANLLAQAANASTVNVEELALGMYNAQGAAKALGVDYEDFVTTLALLAPGFSSAADAGTSFKVLLTRLVPSTKPATAAMRALGLITAEGTNVFFDATGAYVGNREAAELLGGALNGLTAEEKNHYVQAIFGQDASRAAIMLAEAGAAGYDQMSESMAKAGSAAEQAAERNKGFNFALETLKGSVETLQIVLGSALLPILTELINNALIPGVNAIMSFASGITSAEDPMGALAAAIETVLPGFEGFMQALNQLALERIVPGFESLSETLSNTLGPAMQSLASGIMPALTAAVQTVSEYWDVFKGALEGVGALLIGGAIAAGLSALIGLLGAILSPVGLVVAAAVALGVAWETNFLGIRDITAAAFSAIRPYVESFIQSLGSLSTYLGPIQSYLGTLASTLQGALLQAWARLSETLTQNQGRLSELGSALGTIGPILSNIASVVGQVLVGAFAGLLAVAGGIIAFFASSLPGALTAALASIDALKATLTGLATLFANVVNTLVALLKGVVTGDWTALWQAAGQLVSDLASSIGTIFVSLGQALAGVFQGLMDGIIAFFQYLYDVLVGASIVPDMVNAIIYWFSLLPSKILEIVGQLASGLLSAVSSGLASWMATLAQWGQAAWQWLVDAIPQAIAQVTTWGTSLLSYASSTLSAWASTLAQWGQAAWQWLADAIPIAMQKITEWGAGLLSYISTALSSWVNKLAEWARETWEWIADAIPIAMQQITTWWNNIYNYVSGVLPNWISQLAEWAREAWEWLADAMPLLLEKLAEFLDNLISWATEEVLPGIIEFATDWAEEAYIWVTEQAIPGVLQGLSEFLSDMKSKFNEIRDDLESKAEEIGEAIVDAIKNVISNAKSTIANLFKNVIEGAISAAKSALGISSPSKVFEDIGTQTMLGFAQGVLGSAGVASDAVQSALGEALAGINSGVQLGVSAVADAQLGQIAGLGEGALGDLFGRLAAPASGSQISRTAIYNNQSSTQLNLNVSSQQPSQGIVNDFAMMQALAGTAGA